MPPPSSLPTACCCCCRTPRCRSPISLTLEDGPPTGTAYVIAGTVALGIPFLGGKLVPFPDAVVAFPLDAAGGLVVGTSFPPGLPSGASLFWQAWMPDPAAFYGYAATNALRSRAP